MKTNIIYLFRQASLALICCLFMACGNDNPDNSDSTSPAEITNLNAVPGDGQVTLNWTDPTDNDFAKVVITYTPGGNTAIEIGKGVQTAVVSGLTNGTEYTFTLKTVDASGNESAGLQSAAKPEESAEPVPERPADVSNITSVENVPLLTLNNGVQIPQLGLGTQIQRLENDASESGRKLLNDTSHDAVVAALQSGYRHLDAAHGYHNETGVGQAIIDSDVPREEIWVTSKLWPSEYGEGTTMQAIDAMLARLQLDYLDCIYLHHPAGDYPGAWKDLEKAYREGKVRALGISNFDNWPAAFNAIMDNSEIKPQ
ncbi:MAG: aldo/keto reductase, partial [Tannerellaceae bacterium]|nr:aldo/keto reductase [Tannerellaceae bacterium]